MKEIAATKYLGQLRTEAKHIASGNIIQTDAPTDNRGKGETFSPTDLFCTSLASCILTIMGISAMDHGIDISQATIKVFKTMASKPRRIAVIALEIDMRGRFYSPRQKRILTKAAQFCPVECSLSPDIVLKKHWIWAS